VRRRLPIFPLSHRQRDALLFHEGVEQDFEVAVRGQSLVQIDAATGSSLAMKHGFEFKSFLQAARGPRRH
jgi:hypothetical protein